MSLMKASPASIVLGERAPRLRVFAAEERDRRRAHRPGRQDGRRIDGGRPGQSRPCRLPAVAQQVEHRRVVTLDARRQDAAIPRIGGKLEAVELVDHGANAAEAGQLRRRLDVLPREQEPHEVRLRDRLDLGAEALQRGAMNPREQPAIAPLFFDPARRKPAAQHHAIGLEREQHLR